MRGYIGGFFEALGAGGVANVVAGALGYTFLHSYVSAKVAEWQEVPVGDPKAEMITFGGLIVPPVIWGVLRATGKLGDTDMYDMVGNFLGGGMVWESCNLVETIIGLLEA